MIIIPGTFWCYSLVASGVRGGGRGRGKQALSLKQLNRILIYVTELHVPNRVLFSRNKRNCYCQHYKTVHYLSTYLLCNWYKCIWKFQTISTSTMLISKRRGCVSINLKKMRISTKRKGNKILHNISGQIKNTRCHNFAKYFCPSAQGYLHSEFYLTNGVYSTTLVF